MRIGWMVAVLLALSRTAAAAAVTVFVTGDVAALTYLTKHTANALFRATGITIHWHTSNPPAAGIPPNWVRIHLSDRTPDDFLPGALAVSFPYSGCEKEVTVFLDRIRLRAPEILRQSSLLAYVLAHEITHVIQAVDRHSSAGLMKARWDGADYAAIFQRRLDFLEEDLLLVRAGLAAGLCRQEAPVTGRSESGIAARLR